MRNTVLALLLLSFIIPIFPQSKNDDLFYWKDGKLKWSDFQGVAPVNSNPYSSSISYGLGYRPYSKEINGVEYHWIETYSYMDKSSSWAIKDYRTPNMLLYNQVIFDIAELYSRKMQKDINDLTGNMNEIRIALDDILAKSKEQCDNRIKNFIVSTEYGANTILVNYWHGKIEHELNTEQSVSAPPFSLSNWGFGFDFGFGYGMLSNSSSNYFTNPGLMSFGFDIKYKYLLFFIRGLVGFNSSKQAFVNGNESWPKNLKSGLAILDLSVGYPFLKTNRFILTPYIGVGYLEFSSRNQSDQYKDYSFGQFTIPFGINFDYLFLNKIDFFNTLFSFGQTHSSIRTRLMIAPFNFANGVKGWSFNLSVGVGLFGNSINR